MASSLEGGILGVDTFTRDFERLIDTIKSISADARFVFLSPLCRSDDPLHNHALNAYRNAIATLAKRNDQPFVDLSNVAQNPENRKDAIHLNDAGYRELASAIQEQLGLQSDWASSPNTDALRSVILRKNTWWFHR